ncbi:MAG: hypothetical protein R3A78_00360 [Polyangiales bacterium]|nr:hypothetical protein [Myxococcales bacterium]
MISRALSLVSCLALLTACHGDRESNFFLANSNPDAGNPNPSDSDNNINNSDSAVAGGTTLGNATTAEVEALCHGIFDEFNAKIGAEAAFNYICTYDALADVVGGNVNPTKQACEDDWTGCYISLPFVGANIEQQEDQCSDASMQPAQKAALAADGCKDFEVEAAKQCMSTAYANNKTGYDLYTCELANHIEDAASVDQAFATARSVGVTADCTAMIACLDAAFKCRTNLLPDFPGVAQGPRED